MRGGRGRPVVRPVVMVVVVVVLMVLPRGRRGGAAAARVAYRGAAPAQRVREPAVQLVEDLRRLKLG